MAASKSPVLREPQAFDEWRARSQRAWGTAPHQQTFASRCDQSAVRGHAAAACCGSMSGENFYCFVSAAEGAVSDRRDEQGGSERHCLRNRYGVYRAPPQKGKECQSNQP